MVDKGKTTVNSVSIPAALVVLVRYQPSIYTILEKYYEQVFNFNGSYYRHYYSFENAILAWEMSC